MYQLQGSVAVAEGFPPAKQFAWLFQLNYQSVRITNHKYYFIQIENICLSNGVYLIKLFQSAEKLAIPLSVSSWDISKSCQLLFRSRFT